MNQPTITRRAFATQAAAAALALATPGILCGQSPAAIDPALLGKLLSTTHPELLRFAETAYNQCVLGKIRAAAPPLNYDWLVPGGGYYAQWLWDTMFVADLLALLPGQQQLLRGVFQNYWDFQQRWNAAMPAYRHNMVANFMAPFNSPKGRAGEDWRTFPAYSQAPLLAWGMERVFRRNGDLELVRTGLQPLEAFHDWYWRERDVTNIGLIGVGAYSGDVQHARYETYDHEVDLDTLQLTPHPLRPAGPDNGPWYGDILIPANTAYLLLSELSLSRLARLAGNDAMARRRTARYNFGKRAMQQHMWSQQQGCFLAVRRDSQVQSGTLDQIPAPTVGSFMPLMAHVPTPAQARAMAATLASPAWNTPLPIPTVAKSDEQFVASEFWRGDVWPAPDFQVATGLAVYGLHTDAARIADALVANALQHGISERYDSLTGAPLGVAGLGMSSTTLTMMLDGLTSPRFDLRLRARP